jgi:hypothetical protein
LADATVLNMESQVNKKHQIIASAAPVNKDDAKREEQAFAQYQKACVQELHPSLSVQCNAAPVRRFKAHIRSRYGHDAKVMLHDHK